MPFSGDMRKAFVANHPKVAVLIAEQKTKEMFWAGSLGGSSCESREIIVDL